MFWTALAKLPYNSLDHIEKVLLFPTFLEVQKFKIEVVSGKSLFLTFREHPFCLSYERERGRGRKMGKGRRRMKGREFEL